MRWLTILALPTIAACVFILVVLPVGAWRDVGWAGSILLASLCWPMAVGACAAWWAIAKLAWPEALGGDGPTH